MVEMLLARILDELPEAVACPTFADDIMILTKTKREAVAICETLRDALRRRQRPEKRRRGAYRRGAELFCLPGQLRSSNRPSRDCGHAHAGTGRIDRSGDR